MCVSMYMYAYTYVCTYVCTYECTYATYVRTYVLCVLDSSVVGIQSNGAAVVLYHHLHEEGVFGEELV